MELVKQYLMTHQNNSLKQPEDMLIIINGKIHPVKGSIISFEKENIQVPIYQDHIMLNCANSISTWKAEIEIILDSNELFADLYFHIDSEITVIKPNMEQTKKMVGMISDTEFSHQGDSFIAKLEVIEVRG